MEKPLSAEPASHDNLAKRVAGASIAALEFVRHQLASADLNLHEGRLRGSVIPFEYMQISDYPPTHDESI